jgi:hypothetical protein
MIKLKKSIDKEKRKFSYDMNRVFENVKEKKAKENSCCLFNRIIIADSCCFSDDAHPFIFLFFRSGSKHTAQRSQLTD